MQREEREKDSQDFLNIKSKQVDEHLMLRRLTPREEAELDALKAKLAKPVLNEAEFKIFADLIEKSGGKIVPPPQPSLENEKTKPPKKITNIVLTKELVYEYSGRAFLVFPVGSKGNIIHDWDDVSWIPKEEIEGAKSLCKALDLVPLYCEWKLICVKRKDFKIEDDRACA